jgi:NAD(P)H-hydrate epimerase
MASRACLRAGAGLVTIGIPESLMAVYQSRVTEEMTLPLPDAGEGTLSAAAADTILAFMAERADVLCIGPGIGVSDETRRLIASVVRSSRAPVVLDADGLNSLGTGGTKGGSTGEILKKAISPLILTPHPGEMARLLKNSRSRDQIEKDRIGTALSFSEETGVCLVLKGVPTIIADPDGKAYINPTGNPGMATAGSGDVLTGMISALLAQHLSPDHAAVLGVYLHGLAGDIAASEKGQHSLVASDMVEALPAAFRDLKLGKPDLS